jgi:2Fe-2S ferredoxin
MPKIKFISHDGNMNEVQAEVGKSVMRAAVDNGITGILAECGGICSCATCHCYVDENYIEQTGTPSSTEEEMLECVIDPEPNSRLSCQIIVSSALEGAVFHLPEEQ